MNTYPDPSDPHVSSKDREATTDTRMPSSTNLREGTAQDGGTSVRPFAGPKIPTRNPVQNGGNSRSSNQQSGHNIPGKNNTPRKAVNHTRTPSPLPVLLPAPGNCFSREKIVNTMLDRTDQVTSVALFGPIGVGKSSVALTLLHHNRTKTKFGKNRHFMRCDDLANSLDRFRKRLSDIIHTDTGQLHARLQSSHPLILLLDGVDSILDSPAPEARGILSTIQVFGNYEHVCLLTTSRVNPEISGFHPVEVPILSEDGARDTFYGLCTLPRSSAVDSLITRLDFHPLSIELLASCVRENNWNEPMLLQACGDDQMNTLKRSYYPRLRDAIAPALRSPTIEKLGARARNVLKEIAASPSGIKEYKLERKLTGIGEVVDVLCTFSLVYRQDGFVKMLFPFRSYFVEFTLVPPKTEEISYRGHTPAKPCMPFLSQLSHSCNGTHFNGLPVDITGPPDGSSPHATPRPIRRDADHVHGRARTSLSFHISHGFTFQRSSRSPP